jgi:hypothetical protein
VSGQSSSSKIKFFKGQQGIGEALFGPGGPFQTLLQGGSNPMFEAGVQRSRQQLGEDLAQRGLSDSPLGVRSVVDLETGIAQGRESGALQQLLQGVQPIGTTSSGKGFGLCAVADELFGYKSPKANAARKYAAANRHRFFIKVYARNVKRWAAWCQRHPRAKWLISPPWIYMAHKGKDLD